MPFLLCFSYRLYYQYIFIYFSATKKAIHHSFVDTERNTVPTTSTKPISSTTVNLVPRTNAERIVAAICILLIRFLFQTAITIAIKTTFRLWRTVAVAEFEYLIAARNVYWHRRRPASFHWSHLCLLIVYWYLLLIYKPVFAYFCNNIAQYIPDR